MTQLSFRAVTVQSQVESPEPEAEQSETANLTRTKMKNKWRTQKVKLIRMRVNQHRTKCFSPLPNSSMMHFGCCVKHGVCRLFKHQSTADLCNTDQAWIDGIYIHFFRKKLQLCKYWAFLFHSCQLISLHIITQTVITQFPKTKSSVFQLIYRVWVDRNFHMDMEKIRVLLLFSHRDLIESINCVFQKVLPSWLQLRPQWTWAEAKKKKKKRQTESNK